LFGGNPTWKPKQLQIPFPHAMHISRFCTLLAICCRGSTQIITADDVEHVSLLQTHMYRRKTQDVLDQPDLNVLQDQLNKLQRKVDKVSHLHDAKDRKSMMMVDMQSTRPEKDVKVHKDTTDNLKKNKAKKKQKLDKFAKASLAKAHQAQDMEKSAMARIMDDEAGELAEDESHVLSAGALNRLEEVAERVAQSKDQNDESQEFEFDEKRDEGHHDERESKTREDRYHKRTKGDNDGKHTDDDKDHGGDDAVDPEAQLVRLAHERAQREEAKAQLAQSAAKDAWMDLEKFQAQRNIDSFQTGVPVAFSVSQPAPKHTSAQHHA